MGEEKERRKGIRVSISELSQIWLPYNQSFRFTSQDVDSATRDSGHKIQEERPGEHGTEKGKGVEESQVFFSGMLVKEFFDPYRLYIESQGAKEGFIALLRFLDEIKNFSSVRGVKEGGDSQFFGFGEILSKISLGEHSVNVARIMLNLIKETYRDYENLIPKALVSSLGHDIGKAPILSESGAYGKADHPVLSARKVEELFGGREPGWLKDAIEAIKNHHMPKVSDPFSSLLKTSDLKARVMEIASHSENFKVRDWDDWFDPREFLNLLLPEINIIQSGNRWKAFSFGSVVYFQTEFLYESLRELARKKGVVDMWLLRIIEKQDALRKMAESLRKAGMLSDEVREPYWSRYFEIKTSRYRKKMYLVPVRIDAFEVLPHVIEGRKEGYLREIESVTTKGVLE